MLPVIVQKSFLIGKICKRYTRDVGIKKRRSSKRIRRISRLVERYASGKQELFQLCAPERRERLFIEAFLELFESGYAPHVGDVERIANKRVRKLYITTQQLLRYLLI